MRTSYAFTLTAAAMLLWASACSGPAADSVASQPSQTAISQPAATATETPLPATATTPPTDTATPTPAPTDTPTATWTPAPTDTPTPTATRTRVPPTWTFTATPRRAAPAFAQTIMHPFDANDFIKELNELVQFQGKFLAYLQAVVAQGQTGSCYAFYQYRNETIVSQAGYENVPDVWYALYYDYRVALQDAVAAVQPITAVCDAGGGTITPEQDLAIIQVLIDVIARGQQFLGRAAGLPQ